MTKLKQPIVVTIETHEQAISMWHRLNFGIRADSTVTPVSEEIRTILNGCTGPLWAQINSALESASIDPAQPPPQPLRVGQYEVEALEGGSIKVGCTTVNRPTIEAIFKLSSEAMVSEWPKFTKCRGGVVEFHQDHHKSIWHYTNGKKDPVRYIDSYEMAIEGGHEAITPQAAREILEAKG